MAEKIEFADINHADRCSGHPLSRKYGSTGPWTLMVSGLPWRSLALPAVTRTQPSLTQYSSTLVFSTPLKRMPTSRDSTASLYQGLRGSTDRRSGNWSLAGLSVLLTI